MITLKVLSLSMMIKLGVQLPEKLSYIETLNTSLISTLNIFFIFQLEILCLNDLMQCKHTRLHKHTCAYNASCIISFQLCYSENGWNYLLSKGVYYILRDLHLWEEDEEVKSIIDTWVSYYLVEEYSESKGNDHYSEDSFLIQQLQSDIIKDLPDFLIQCIFSSWIYKSEETYYYSFIISC